LDETAELIVTATSKQQRLSLIRAFHSNRYVTKGPAKTHLNIDEVLTVFDCRLGKVLFRANYTSQMAFCANETQIVKSFIHNIKESKVGEFCATYFSEFDPKYDKSKYQILRDLGITKSSAYLILKKDLLKKILKKKFSSILPDHYPSP
jgi:hypothetical protein